ncbi:MAG: hypothetical protein AAF447_24220 [Myxococcota bacterium]
MLRVGWAFVALGCLIANRSAAQGPLKAVLETQIPDPGDTFSGDVGAAVAVSRDGRWAAVGAPSPGRTAVRGEAFDGGHGAVFVFRREAGEWQRQALLLPHLPEDGHEFGSALAFDATGTRLAVGAPLEDGASGRDSGVYFVFRREADDRWVEEARRVARRPRGGARVGRSLALSGDGARMLVGSRGAVLVAERSGDEWTETQQLVSPRGLGTGHFGLAMAIDEAGGRALLSDQEAETDVLVVRVFERDADSGAWELGTTLTPGSGGSYGGAALSADGSRALVRFSGEGLRVPKVHVWSRDAAGAWSFEDTLEIPLVEPSSYSESFVVDANGTRALVSGSGVSGASSSIGGAAFLYVRSGSGLWNLQSTLEPTMTPAHASFGTSVAMDDAGAYVFVGAPGEDGVDRGSGAVHIFERSEDVWGPSERLSGTSGFDDFDPAELSASADGTRLLVGLETPADGSSSVAAQVYVREASGAWSVEATFDEPSRGVMLSKSLAISGEGTVIAISFYDGDLDTDDEVHIYRRSGGRWTREAIVRSDLADPRARFYGGELSLSADGSTLVVAAEGTDEGALFGVGVVFVYERSEDEWTRTALLRPSDGMANERFGSDVSLSATGDVLLIGASGRMVGPFSDRGTAYVFRRDATSSGWSEETRLELEGSGLRSDRDYFFGEELDLSEDGTRAVVKGWTVVRFFERDAALGWAEAAAFDNSANRGPAVLSGDGRRALVGRVLPDARLEAPVEARLYARDTAGLWTRAGAVRGRPRLGTSVGWYATLSADGARAFVSSSLDLRLEPPGPTILVLSLEVGAADGDACVGDDDCTTFFCDAGVCAAQLTEGDTCSDGRSCESGFCVDGVCCRSGCDRVCEACAEPGSEGRCILISGEPRGSRSCASDGSTCGGFCGGLARQDCRFPEVGNPCGEASCEAGVASVEGSCDGFGVCLPAPLTTCAPYICEADAPVCRIACARQSDCVDGFMCRAAQCLPPLPQDMGVPDMGPTDMGTRGDLGTPDLGSSRDMNAMPPADAGVTDEGGGGCAAAGVPTAWLAGLLAVWRWRRSSLVAA